MQKIADLLKYISEAIIEKAWLKRCQQNEKKVLEEYIDEHIQEVLKVETLARAANCSVSFITHNFQASFGAAPQQFIREKKLTLARQRLLVTFPTNSGRAGHAARPRDKPRRSPVVHSADLLRGYDFGQWIMLIIFTARLVRR